MRGEKERRNQGEAERERKGRQEVLGAQGCYQAGMREGVMISLRPQDPWGLGNDRRWRSWRGEGGVLEE